MNLRRSVHRSFGWRLGRDVVRWWWQLLQRFYHLGMGWFQLRREPRQRWSYLWSVNHRKKSIILS
uniref:Uncharacterized protein n=1 Tax=Megaselia scalaris TaxID=36166 RepID=T1GRG9_MEGSC